MNTPSPDHRWSERQQAMLEAMGLRLWQAPGPAQASATVPSAQAVGAGLAAAAGGPTLTEFGTSGQPAAGAAHQSGQRSDAAKEASAPRIGTPEATAFSQPAPAAPAARTAEAGMVPARTSTASGPAAGATPSHPASPLAAGSAPGQPPAASRVGLVGNRLAAAAIAHAPPPAPPTERAQRIARMDWAELQAEVASCRACALCEKRRHTVFGVGHPQAAWMLVGEAPGEQEDRQGEPFIGPAGQLLDQILATLGLDRRAGTERAAEAPEVAKGAQPVFIANTLKCRPPQNRNPTPEELALCAPFLHRQIALVQPRLLVASGRFAIEQLLATQEAVGRLRGKLHRYAGAGSGSAAAEPSASAQTAAPGTPVVVTYHPSYLLRQPTEKARAWEDWCLAMDSFLALPPK